MESNNLFSFLMQGFSRKVQRLNLLIYPLYSIIFNIWRTKPTLKTNNNTHST